MQTDSKARKRALTVAGIRLRFHPSWFAVFALTTVTVGLMHLRGKVPGYSTPVYLAAGFVIASIFALSLLLHELSHSLVALRSGVPVPEITMHLLGGLSRVQAEAQTPRDDAWIAAAGPLCSLVFAVGFGALTQFLPLPSRGLAWHVLAYGAFINVALVLFNLIPGLPLDGGRIVRAFLWWKTGSLTRATHLAAQTGTFFAYAIMLFGVVQFLQGYPLSGVWNVLIGVFMRAAASTTVDFAYLNATLRGLPVSTTMLQDVALVPETTPLAAALHEYFVRHGYSGFPVCDGKGHVTGVLTLRHIQKADPGCLAELRVADVMDRNLGGYFVPPDEGMQKAYVRMQDLELDRLFVGSPERLVGMVTQTALMRYAEIQRALETHVWKPNPQQ